MADDTITATGLHTYAQQFVIFAGNEAPPSEDILHRYVHVQTRCPQKKKKTDYSFIKDSVHSVFGYDNQLSTGVVVIASFIGEKVCTNLLISGLDWKNVHLYFIYFIKNFEIKLHLPRFLSRRNDKNYENQNENAEMYAK
jgi:hypothetical protein